MAACVHQPAVAEPMYLDSPSEQLPETVMDNPPLELEGAPLLPQPADEESDTAPAQPEIRDVSSFLQSGIASWYGNRFQGRRTASGEYYNLHALTAAHRTLPIGSYVRVTAVKSARSVIVRINDRGPYVQGRVIDLSYAAAEALNLPRSGTLLVRIERVGRQEAGS